MSDTLDEFFDITAKQELSGGAPKCPLKEAPKKTGDVPCLRPRKRPTVQVNSNPQNGTYA